MHPAMKPTILATALILVFTGCWWSTRELNVRGAWVSPQDETRIELQVGRCEPKLSSRVEETDTEVRVLVTTRDEAPGDCGGVHTITLSEPLGDRLLIDEYDGEPVAVRGRPTPAALATVAPGD